MFVEHYFVNQKNHDTVTVGGVTKLKEFAPTCIVVGVRGADITIFGEKMSILHFDENEIIIKGRIENTKTDKRRTKL